ncbi:DUF305 domain-containing protein [Devosia sp. RR2S18]|nr:DUF305 domain-containing protein [Devosia sp. RR2S18]WIJ26455.1 DUF305 domain-containing protein [Devosia sp. RR2S18]
MCEVTTKKQTVAFPWDNHGGAPSRYSRNGGNRPHFSQWAAWWQILIAAIGAVSFAPRTRDPDAVGVQRNHAMDEAHADLMNGMDEMNRQMMIGMMAEDIDVAFVCGMIPHHQSAVNMAKAQLKHGDDLWAKELAQAVIGGPCRHASLTSSTV